MKVVDPSVTENGSGSEAQLTTELLKAYADILEAVDRLPRVVWVPTNLMSVRVPRFRWFARMFVVQHVRKSLHCLARRHHARKALGHEPEQATELATIEHFIRSLPPLPSRLFVTAAMSIVFLTALALGSLLAQHQADSKPLADATQAILQINPGALVSAVEEFRTWESVVVAAVGLSAALYLVVFLPMGAFRLQRMLFNLYPDVTAAHLRNTNAASHVFGTGGAYVLEERTFEATGAQRQPEPRFDLAVDGVLMALALCLGVFFVAQVFIGFKSDANTSGTLLGGLSSGLDILFARPQQTLPALGLVTVACARLVRLAQAWSGRHASPTAALAARAHAEIPVIEAPLADFGRRAGAQIIDLVLLGIGWFVLGMVWAAFYNENADPSGARAALALFVINPGLVVLLGAIPIGCRGKWNGRSVGKRVLGLRVISADRRPLKIWRAVFRELLCKCFLFGLFSMPFLGIPVFLNYLWPLRDERRRALHDRLAATLVVRS